MMYGSGTSTIFIIFMLIPSILCMIMYNYAITHSSDLLYYVILDGMMMLSALLLYIYLNSVSFVSL
jgi:uncharacterized protein YqhQ